MVKKGEIMFQTKAVKCGECELKAVVRVGFPSECENCGNGITIEPRTLREAKQLIENLMDQRYDIWHKVSKVSGYLNTVDEQFKLNLPATTYYAGVSISRKIIDETLDIFVTW